MRYELRKSADGSWTLYSKEYDECYHSLKDGVLKEAFYKHVEPAFTYTQKKELRILDICFGLGINTLMTIDFFLHHQNEVESIKIFSPELDAALIEQLATFPYPPRLELYRDIVKQLIQNKVYKSDNMEVELYIGDARVYIKELDRVDVVYQDAFSPKKNPILWTVEYFKDIANILDKEGVLTTYSIATPVRLALWEAGLRVYEKELSQMKKITIASFKELPLTEIDMELKASRSSAKVLRDNEI